MKKFFILFFLFLPVFALGQEKININTATPEQLDALTGIGPVYAQRIIDARPFSSVDDLLRVNGIGEKTLQKIKEQGLAYVETQELIVQEESIEEAPPLDIPEISYPDGIIISKIMPSPEGSDTENEYVELQNKNDFEVNLTGWILRDKQGVVAEYNLTEKIPALASLTLFRPDTKITLNNSGDGIELLNPSGKVVDSVDFGKAETGIVYIRTGSSWKWDMQESVGQKSAPVLAAAAEALPEIQPKTKQEVEINLSSESQKSNLSVYLTALFVALLFSLIFFVLLKKSAV